MRETDKVFYQKIQLPFKVKKAVLALGSQTKNTLCLVRGESAYISRIHPDLSNPRDLADFENDLKFFLKLGPDIIAADLHPEYVCARYALQAQVSLIQHHHAHIASCMAENGLQEGKVIGVAFDGTGLGSDGSLWGGEFLVCGYKHFKRVAHLKEIALVSGFQAIQEPWRIAALWLHFLYKDGFLNLKNDFVRKLDRKKWTILKKMYAAGFNSARSSSMGRLFDAVASLVLAKYNARLEAGLAIELENTAKRYKLSAARYPYKILSNKDGYIIDPSAVFKAIVIDLGTKESQEKIAYRFHKTCADMVLRVCLILRKKYKTDRVVLSGGVFQNKLLLRMTLDLLYKNRLRVFMHKKLSCNDSGISLGQAIILGARGSF